MRDSQIRFPSHTCSSFGRSFGPLRDLIRCTQPAGHNAREPCSIWEGVIRRATTKEPVSSNCRRCVSCKLCGKAPTLRIRRWSIWWTRYLKSSGVPASPSTYALSFCIAPENCLESTPIKLPTRTKMHQQMIAWLPGRPSRFNCKATGNTTTSINHISACLEACRVPAET